VPLIEANGLRFHVQVMGEGPPLVMLHGLLVGSVATWYFGAAPRLARRHRVLLYDLRGHGRTERAARGYDVATMAADLDALLDWFDPRPVCLVGHSYGGLIALRYAMARPSRVRSLAVVDAPLPPSRLDGVAAFLQQSPDELSRALPAAVGRDLARGGRRWRSLMQSLQFLARESTLGADVAAEKDVPDEELSRVSAPLLCVYGERSACRGVGERLARVVPGASLRLLDGGHWLPVEASAALTACLAEHFHA
jgi:pimeloyl-ACP methyl ester carboxylesterase